MTDERKIARNGNDEWFRNFDKTWLELAAAYDIPIETMKELSRMKCEQDFSPIDYDIDIKKMIADNADEENAKSKKKKQIKNGIKKRATKKKSDVKLKEKNSGASGVNGISSTSPPMEKVNCNVCNTLVSKRYFHNHIRSRLHTKNLSTLSSSANSELAS